MIQVTKTSLPAFDTYVEYLRGIWERHHLTNHGPLVLELEARLKEQMEVEHFFAVCNGTVALQIAIEALGLTGEIITTPFSYVATTSSIAWQHCQPVFVDIDPVYLTLDPAKIEAAITPATTGILATHVFGFPCDIEGIEAVAKRHGLKVIYDAAHCFGVRYQDRGIMSYGDISISSFHATKLFHTAEGGCLTTSDPEVAHRISYMRNFGHRGQTDFWGMGINGKMSELHAAMGLAMLPLVGQINDQRQLRINLYRELLDGRNGLWMPSPRSGTNTNAAYCPLIFPDETSLLSALQRLNAQDIYPRRYFYPNLHQLPYVAATPMANAEEIASQIICLPLADDLPFKTVELIAANMTDVKTSSHLLGCQ